MALARYAVRGSRIGMLTCHMGGSAARNESVASLHVETVRNDLRRFWRRHPTLSIGTAVIVLMVLLAIAAPLFAGNPLAMDPMHRLRPPSGL